MHHKYISWNPMYTMVELSRFNFSPFRIALHSMNLYLNSQYDITQGTSFGRTLEANVEIMDRITQKYPKPEFGIKETEVDGAKKCLVEQETILSKPFCKLLHFKKISDIEIKQPKLLIVAPMAGHHATLLRGTVQGMLPHADVYITDWISASEVPISEGGFDLDDYIDYLMEFLRFLGPNIHVLAVCQPTVPLLAATSLMSEVKDKCMPKSMIMMGGPIDARENPTAVNHFATGKPMKWFEHSLITSVPVNYPGFSRRVYPGFLQLAGFISMNWQSHIDSHVEMYKHFLVEDDEKAQPQIEFYNEYLSVMDLSAEFYLQTIEEVFHKFSIAKNKMVSRGRK
ncbi:MAG: polyhydroxyalkanoate depolymerase, partial [Rickettsiaceae bacterium]|nr:polyhydroxyalkanoate depolymerase [Rickettsiaceae bacterium]